MKKLQNVQYGRYAIFVVVLVLFLLTSHAVFAKDNTTKITGQEHRSEVAKIVQELRRVAGQDSTIGQ